MEEKLKQLEIQREQMLANYNAILGAIQVLKELIEESKKPVDTRQELSENV